MSIEIPHEVALFLNFCGVPYPDIDEDQVHELADRVREFADNVRETHETAGTTIKEMGAVYSGYSYSQLLRVWAGMSNTHMVALDRGCRAVATALDLTAEVIRAMKIAVFAELSAMAVSYGTALSTSIATGGLSFALAEALRAAARKLCSVMEQVLLGYILSEVIGKAIEPLEHTIDSFVHGTLFDATRDLLGVPEADPHETLRIEPDEVTRYAGVLDDLADDILRHAANFADAAGKLTFTTAGPMVPPPMPEVPALPPPAARLPIAAAPGGPPPTGNVPAEGPDPAAEPVGMSAGRIGGRSLPVDPLENHGVGADSGLRAARPSQPAVTSGGAPAGAAGGATSPGQSSPWSAPVVSGAAAHSSVPGAGVSPAAERPAVQAGTDVPVTAESPGKPMDSVVAESISTPPGAASPPGAGHAVGAVAGASASGENPAAAVSGDPASAPLRSATTRASPTGQAGVPTGKVRSNPRKTRSRRDTRAAGTPWARKRRRVDVAQVEASEVTATPWSKDPATVADAAAPPKVFAPESARRPREPVDDVAASRVTAEVATEPADQRR